MQKILLAIFVMLSTFLSAQDSTMIFIETGHVISDILTPDKIYRFPQFVNGKVFFRDGSLSEARLNYNYINAEIEFIDPKNDTLAISKDQMMNIREVLIDSAVFVYNDGYMELVTKSNLGKLYRKQEYVVSRREKIGAYNIPTATSAIDNYGTFVDEYGVFYPGLKIRENITLVLRTRYYMDNKSVNFSRASRRNMLDMYRSHRDELRKYIDDNKVDFRNGDDLKKLYESF